MTIDKYRDVVDALTNDRKKVSQGKRKDYTRGSEDVLANFKNQGEDLGIDPKLSLAVHMEKQFSAVMNYIKTNGESESEPIIKRIGDTINYLELLWGLINDLGNQGALPEFDQQPTLFDQDILEDAFDFEQGFPFNDKDFHKQLSKYHPDFHRTRIATVKFRLRTDVPNIGTKGWVFETSKPTNFGYINGRGETVNVNLFEDERFEEVK